MAAEGTELAAHPGEFGMQVRNLRIAAGLTQAELAEHSGISERTVSDLERGLRATAYPSTARRLAAALEIGPEGLAAFVSQARGLGAVDGPSARSAAMPSQQRARLPSPLTRLLGREAELSMVLALIKDPGIRLVTLVGIGGIGKTRLAVEVAARAQGGLPRRLVLRGTVSHGRSGDGDPRDRYGVRPAAGSGRGAPGARSDPRYR